MAVETPMSDHVARFWQHLETETVRILIDLRREVGHDAPDGPSVYWDGASFGDDVAKALVADRVAGRETVANWMILRGYATGHGNTIQDLLFELEAQLGGPKEPPPGEGDFRILQHENERLKEIIGRIGDANERIRIAAEQEKKWARNLVSAIQFAHAEGFQWPSDPLEDMAEHANPTDGEDVSLRTVLRQTLESLEYLHKKVHPDWDGTAEPWSVIGEARAAITTSQRAEK